MVKKTPTRPSMLSSRIARTNLLPEGLQGDGAVIPIELASTFSAIDRLASIWDALDSVRASADPTKTPEANALAYREAYDKAMTSAKTAIKSTTATLINAREKAIHEARGRAGLLADYRNSREIQAVLRSMEEKDREAAISAAIERGDHEIMAAVYQAHPILIGSTKLPLNALIQMHVEKAAPEEAAKVTTIDGALEHLNLAAGQFHKSADAMRDRQREEDGEAGAKAAREAEAKLALAVSDLQPARASEAAA